MVPIAAATALRAQTYWRTTRVLDRSTAPFTAAVIVRPSDKDEAAAKALALAEQLASNACVTRALDADDDAGAHGRATLAVAIGELLGRGIPRAGYLKVSVEDGARELWADV